MESKSINEDFISFSRQGNIDIVKYILEKCTIGREGLSIALYNAAMDDNFKMAEFLIVRYAGSVEWIAHLKSLLYYKYHNTKTVKYIIKEMDKRNK